MQLFCRHFFLPLSYWRVPVTSSRKTQIKCLFILFKFWLQNNKKRKTESTPGTPASIQTQPLAGPYEAEALRWVTGPIRNQPPYSGTPSLHERKKSVLHNAPAQNISIFAFANIYSPSSFWEVYGWTFQAVWTSGTFCQLPKIAETETSRLLTSDDPDTWYASDDPESWFAVAWGEGGGGGGRTTQPIVMEFNFSVIVVTKIVTYNFLLGVVLRMRDTSAKRVFL